MSIDTLLSRLEGAKSVGHGKWIAKCPAHDDRSPSLAVREIEEGRILVHCFAGCGAADVVAAIGLALSDLFEKPLYHRAGGVLDQKYVSPTYRAGMNVLPPGWDRTRGYHESRIEILCAAIQAGDTISRDEIAQLQASADWVKAHPIPELKPKWR
jgi:hypothetical protein